jgi:hypothetical protein
MLLGEKGALWNRCKLQQCHLFLCFCELALATACRETTVTASDSTRWKLSLLRPLFLRQFSSFKACCVNFSYSFQCRIACQFFMLYNTVLTCWEVCSM